MQLATATTFTERLCAAYDFNRGFSPADGPERATREEIVEYIDAHTVERPPSHPTKVIAWDLQRTLGESEGRRMLLYASRRWDAKPLRARDIIHWWWEVDGAPPYEPQAWRDEYLLDVIRDWRLERDRLRERATREAEKAAANARIKRARERMVALERVYDGGWRPAAGERVTWTSLLGMWVDHIDRIEAAIEYFEKSQALSGKIPMPSNVTPLHPAVSVAPVLPVFCAASLEGHAVPPRRWHSSDLIPAQTVTLMYGDGGTGKSLLALQLLVSTAIGRPWLGRMVEKGSCLFVTAEDSRDEVHRRLFDIARENNVPLSAMADLHIVSLAGEDAIIAAPEGRSNVITITPLFTAIDEQIRALRPKLVVLDTLADLFGGNEIDRAQARQFIGLLRGLALRYDCTIVVLAHPSLSGMDRGTSGSTGWGNSVRSRLQFARVHESDGREADEDARVLRVGKSNYGRVGLEIPMRYQRGVFVADRLTAGGDPLARDAKSELLFLELLAKHREQNSYVSIVHTSPLYAPKVFNAEAKKQGVGMSDLKGAMQRLLDAKKIENAPHGSLSKKQFRLHLT